MKYSTENALYEIKRRKDHIRQTREKMITGLLSGLSTGLAMMLFFCIISISSAGESGLSDTVYGTFLLSGEAGAFVLTGVIAFTLGVAITLICLRLGHKGQDETEE